MMTFEQFSTLADRYAAVPVYRKILADLVTPVSAFMRLTQRDLPGVLLESVEGGKQYARYSYIGIQPRLSISHRNGVTTRSDGDRSETVSQPFMDVLREAVAGFRSPMLEDLPAFTGGLVGFMGYETIVWAEDVPIHPASDDDLPDALFLLLDTMMIFDHLKQEIVVCYTAIISSDRPLREQYDHALAIVDKIGATLHTDIDYQTPPVEGDGEVAANMTREEFEAAVVKAKEHIVAGDVFQIVLSQRFSRCSSVAPLTLYRALRNINPSPYMFILHFEDFAVIGASPEILVKVTGNEIEVRPIAGTRPRGKDAHEDARLAEDLLADEKERAEHLMLVDLGRNDVGRTSKLGTVRVHEFMVVEKYSHVMHIVSDVRGELRDELDALAALIACSPGGTVSGAPKIRAMELIHDLEPDRRGVYTGAVGYLDFHGNLNTCIAIRTLVLKDGRVHFQSGAGIVADSEPGKEYEEAVDKARAIMQAVDFAERGLG